MAILYTPPQVNSALLRAQVGMYLISQNIENGFNYLYSPVYQTYKALQYDIYILWNIITNENPFVTYSSTPTPHETSFYELVGSLINKTKQFDVYGQFNGNVSPYYQPPAGTVIKITTTGSIINSTQIPFTAQTTIVLTYTSALIALYGKTPLVCQIYVDNGSNPASPDFGTAPIIDFVVSGDPTSGFASVTWGYGVPTTGYIYLSGVMGS